MKPYIPTLLVALLFLSIPAAIWLERSERSLWNDRLFLPSFSRTVNRHTPLHPVGTYLPPVISKDTRITAEQNPVLISGTVTVPRGVTLTVDPNVNIYVHEYGALNIEGALRMNGSSDQIIEVTTNEEHIENRTWGGLLFQPGSTGVISHTHIRHASPGISCIEGSSVDVQQTDISHANVGIYTESDQCRIANSVIEHVDDGIIAVGTEPATTNTVIRADDKETKLFSK